MTAYADRIRWYPHLTEPDNYGAWRGDGVVARVWYSPRARVWRYRRDGDRYPRTARSDGDAMRLVERAILGQ
jgi:hypothetical protein